VLIAASVQAVGLVTFFDLGVPALRILLTAWFLLVCPGLAIILIFQVEDRLSRWTLAIALSLALDALVAGFLLYADMWSYQAGITALMWISLAGLVIQILQVRQAS
jgi:hypothetical protein